MSLAELADWWDAQLRASEDILGDWVQENPQWWAIGVATLASTSMRLGAGMVDALRLGQGAAQGGFGGYLHDGARLLVFLGPLARVGGTIGRAVHTQQLRLAVQTQGVTGPCTFTAVNNAATIVRGRATNIFLTAREAAQALNVPLRSVPTTAHGYELAAWIDQLVPFVTRLGVRVRSLGTPRNINDVIEAARSRDGVVVFAIEWTDIVGDLHRHSMIAVRTVEGVRFADYGGKFISQLSELALRRGIWLNRTPFRVAHESGVDSMVLFEGMKGIGAMERYARTVFQGGMLLIEGVHAVETSEHGVDLAFPVAAAATLVPENEPEVVKASFEAYRARRSGQIVSRLSAVRPKGAPHVSRLAGVQYRLNALGFAAGKVDGVQGPVTKRAVIAFQKAYNLASDGVAGPKTQAKLSEVCGF